MKLQKMDTTKRLNTESQTKNPRATHSIYCWLVIRKYNAIRLANKETVDREQ